MIASKAMAEEKLIHSLPEQVAAISSEEDWLVGGLVSPISGQACLRKTDLFVEGAEHLSQERVYIAPCIPVNFHKDRKIDEFLLYKYLNKNYQGWVANQKVRLEISAKDPSKLRVPVADGIVLDFEVKGDKTRLVSDPYGVNNLGSDGPSGKYDIRNTQIVIKNEQILVITPDGSRRYYKPGFGQERTFNYLLYKEILPNGKILRFHYTNCCLSKIESLSPNEQHVYASNVFTKK
jgi:hypothetical protein